MLVLLNFFANNLYLITRLHHKTQHTEKILSNFILQCLYFWLWDFLPTLPNYAICIYRIEYSYPQTRKIFWLGKGGSPGVGAYLSKTFPVSYKFNTKINLVMTEIQTCFISLRENERQFTKYRFMAKNLWFSQKMNFEVVARAIFYRDCGISFLELLKAS